MNDEGKHEHRSLTGGAGPYIMLGWQIAFAFVGYAALGYLVDYWLETAPWFLLAGVILGLVAVFARIYNVSLQAGRKSKSGAGAKGGDDRAHPTRS